MTLRPAILLSIAVCSFALGLCALRFYAEHNYTSHDSLYRVVGGLGLFLLSMAFVLTLLVYGRWSFKLRPPLALLLGIGSMAVAWALGRFLSEIVSVHSWNFVFLVLPLAIFLSGGVAMVISGVRLMKKYMEAQYK